MNMMNDLLGEYVDQCVLVFLDDILVYSASMEEHVEHLRRVLSTFRKYRRYAKTSKCKFVTTIIEFLGQQISGGGCLQQRQKSRRFVTRPRHRMLKMCVPLWALQIITNYLFAILQNLQAH